MGPASITLHEFRWPFAAARAGIWLALMAAIAVMDPAPGRSVDPPNAVSAEPFQVFRRDIDIVVGRYGTIIAGSYHADESSAKTLAWLRQNNPRSRLILRADRNVDFGSVRRIIQQASAAGFRQVTVETRSSRPLFLRRLDTWPRVEIDASELREPPDDGIGFSLNRMWY